MRIAHSARPRYPAYRDLTSRHPLRTLAAGAVVALGLVAAVDPLARFLARVLA